MGSSGTSRRRWLQGAAGFAAARPATAILGIAPALLISGPTARAQAARPAGRRLVLGQSVPLTGAASEIGTAFAAGAKLYIDAWNARPANASLRIELRQVDDGYDARRATENARRLVADGGADVLFGFVGTDSAQAGAEVARKEGVPFFAPFAAPDSLRESSQSHVFHVRPSMADEAIKMVRHCATLGQNRIAILAEDDALGRAGLAALQLAFAELKLPPPVASVTVPPNTDKVDAAVAQMLKAQPNAVILASLFQSTVATIRQLRKGGYAGSVLNFSVVGIDPLFTALGKDISGVVVTQVVPSPRSQATPVVREYLNILDSTDQVASYESLEGFIAAKALAESLKRAGRLGDRAALLAAMNSMRDYDVGGLRINLRPGIRDAARAIDLVTITADGRVIR